MTAVHAEQVLRLAAVCLPSGSQKHAMPAAANSSARMAVLMAELAWARGKGE